MVSKGLQYEYFTKSELDLDNEFVTFVLHSSNCYAAFLKLCEMRSRPK